MRNGMGWDDDMGWDGMEGDKRWDEMGWDELR